MHPELDRLITLQAIETRTAEARKRIAEAPERVAALDAKLTASRDELTRAKQALADNQAARRTIERDLLAVQQRLSKSKETLMEVKTNAEYHAMQTQIATAEADVGRVEEQLLIRMVEADDITARVKAAEAALKDNEAKIAAERKAIETDAAEMERLVRTSAEERAALMSQIERAHLEIFDRVMKARQGIAVAEAIDGHCSVCHVALRPQVFNTIRRNDSITQCDHCQRILYFTGVHKRSEAGHAAVNAPSWEHGDSEPSSR